MKIKRKAAIISMLFAVIFIFSASLALAQDSEDLNADFTYSAEGKKVIFESTSTGNITSYLWVFPDGSDSTEQHPIHEFSDENEYYSVNLTVTDEQGMKSTVTKNVKTGDTSDNKTMIILGCAIAIGIAGMGSAIGLALAGSSAVAVTAEKPELFSKCLILQVLPMTQSVYGLLTAILLMMGAGLLGGTAEVSSLQAIGAVWIGLAVGLTGLSAINQGMVASSSISAVARNPEIASKGIIFTVMPETIAIFGLLVGILLMVGLGLL